ncbi:MAG TPA: hypothetical protein VGD84_06640, partial [Pseudonocardiaceae bacterium]
WPPRGGCGRSGWLIDGWLNCDEGWAGVPRCAPLGAPATGRGAGLRGSPFARGAAPRCPPAAGRGIRCE